MAMLAERKTKRKWCLNPNGKDWSEDNNKFGQKMLEKMGWKKGCGLGVNLQGQKEHVKVSIKNDSKGLGCEANYDLEWLNHQDNYNNLLSELSSSNGNGILTVRESSSGPSLEDKSKTSRARVHYKKFVRGKDVSRYSGTDLMCILGKTETFTQKKKPIDDVENEVPETNPKINPKKKSDGRCDEHLVDEYSVDRKSRKQPIEVMDSCDTDLMFVVEKTESITDESRPVDDVENEVPETIGRASMKKKKKKKKNSSEEMEEGRDEEFVRGEDVSRYSDTDSMSILGQKETVTQKRRPIYDFENEVPEKSPKIQRKKKKKDKRNERCDEKFVEDYSNGKEKMGNCDRDLMFVAGKTESGIEASPVDGVENEVQKTNGKTSMKKKKKNRSEEREDGRDEEFAEESPENRKSKRRKEEETGEVSSTNAALCKEKLICKFQGDEISISDSFNGSNLHVVKGYKYDRR